MITNWNEHLKINNMIKNDIFYEMYMHRNLFRKKNLSGSNMQKKYLKSIFASHLLEDHIIFYYL